MEERNNENAGLKEGGCKGGRVNTERGSGLLY